MLAHIVLSRSRCSLAHSLLRPPPGLPFRSFNVQRCPSKIQVLTHISKSRLTKVQGICINNSDWRSLISINFLNKFSVFYKIRKTKNLYVLQISLINLKRTTSRPTDDGYFVPPAVTSPRPSQIRIYDRLMCALL